MHTQQPPRPWQPEGTVYGTLLNFRREWDLWSPRMTQDPHKAAPKAPVLYIKTVPHTSYYRPPVKFRCRDGFLGLPPQPTPGQVQDWASLQISVRRNGTWVQTVDLRDLVRQLPALLADVGAFMTLQPGDVLMVGTDCLADGTRPRAQVGDQVEISAPGLATVTTTDGGAA